MEFSDMQNISEMLKTRHFAFVLSFSRKIRMSFQRNQSSERASFPLVCGAMEELGRAEIEEFVEYTKKLWDSLVLG